MITMLIITIVLTPIARFQKFSNHCQPKLLAKKNLPNMIIIQNVFQSFVCEHLADKPLWIWSHNFLTKITIITGVCYMIFNHCLSLASLLYASVIIMQSPYSKSIFLPHSTKVHLQLLCIFFFCAISLYGHSTSPTPSHFLSFPTQFPLHTSECISAEFVCVFFCLRCAYDCLGVVGGGR